MPLPKCVRTKSDMPGWREIGDFAVYERTPLLGGWTPFVRLREHWEVPVIKAIADHFTHDRLHLDPEVSEQEADEFKSGMVDRAVSEGFPILTCGQPDTLGFLIVRPEGNVANIDLIGVSPNARRRGIGTALIGSFLHWAHLENFDLCRAGTMDSNRIACKLYESFGFTRSATLRTFHK